MTSIIKTRGIVLSSIRWHESSKIVTLYTEKLGKIKVIARGALKDKSSFRGDLEALNELDVIISVKQARSLQILTETELEETFNAVKADWNRLPIALAILELINEVFDEGHADQIFYNFTVSVLRQTGELKTPFTAFWYFLLKLSSFLGFKPNLNNCQTCGADRFDSDVFFSVEQGAVYCDNCARGAGLSIKINPNNFDFLRKLQDYHHRQLKKFEEQSKSSYDFTNILIDYLNHHIDRKIVLNSLSMFS
ncbi:MAG: DNA repair protein RecO [Calditrichaceae bacterium]